MMRFVQAISVHGEVASSAQHNLLRLAMSHYTRDYGQTSSWYNKGRGPSKSTYSGWSKRATFGYQLNYDRDDRRHEWDDHASRGSGQARGAPPETSAAADVEIVDERDKSQGMASANNAAGSGADTATLVPVGDAATEKDAITRRRGELHRLLNSRKGSLSATYKKNAEANDKAYDLNQKTLQALDAVAADHVAFEAAVVNVTSEHEAGDAIHAAAAETAGELERVQKVRAGCMIWLRPSGSSPTALQPRRPRAQNCATLSGSNRRATHEAICVEKLSARPRRYKKAWRHTGSEQDASRTSTPERKATSMTELAPWVELYKPRSKPRTA